jgi:hypothetical protein
MGTYIESGIGSANCGSALEIGRKAALQALSQVPKFTPSLALEFVSSEVDIEEVNRGVVEVLGDCPLIGTSTAGEIANGLVRRGVVMAILASPHLRARVGMGKGVSKDFRRATQEALTQAGAFEYFNQGHPLHQMLHVSASGMPGISPVFLIVFSPNARSWNPPCLSSACGRISKLSRVSGGPWFWRDTDWRDRCGRDGVFLCRFDKRLRVHRRTYESAERLCPSPTGGCLSQIIGIQRIFFLSAKDLHCIQRRVC